MNNRYFKLVLIPLFFSVAAILATGCAPADSTPATSTELIPTLAEATQVASVPATDTPAPEPVQPTSTPPAFDEARLANLAYTLETISQVLPESDGNVTLANGHFEQGLPDSTASVTVDLIRSARGDLNGDGIEDGLALLAVDTGGSGTFLYLVAIINQAGELQQAADLFLGDRVDVQSMEIKDGSIQVPMLTHAPDDPQCCPSLEETRQYRLENNQLVTPEQSQVLPLAESALQALKDRDMATLAALAHPENGVRFSPYSFVLPEHQSFSAESLANLLGDPTTYTWGAFDGSGEPIQMTFKDYFERFVYSKDFASAGQVGLDQRLGRGNTLDNSHEFYPEAVVVEYFIPGENPEYGRMDWQSLRLVFQQVDGSWYLAGVIHDEWTI
jgi:hypothetical protein